MPAQLPLLYRHLHVVLHSSLFHLVQQALFPPVHPSHPLTLQGVVLNSGSRINSLKPVNGTVSLGLLNVQSVSNKTAIITKTILEHHLDIFCAVETWHDGADSPSLIACTPPNYKFIEKARIRDHHSSLKLNTNHGGICVFLRSTFRVRAINLPNYKTMEALALSVHGSVLATTLITLYRPGSQSVTSTFFEEFSDLLDRCSSSNRCILVGDINIHLDICESSTSIQFQSLIRSFGLVECVNKSPTHVHHHQLDVFITNQEIQPPVINVDPPIISDHSLIIATYIVAKTSTPPDRPRVLRRKWRSFDIDRFTDDLLSSDLVSNPPDDNVDKFFNSYDETLRNLLDKHAPQILVTDYSRPASPWFDTECHLIKVRTRKLEKQYRSHPNSINKMAWRSQFRRQRILFELKSNTYWKFTIQSAAGNSKSLWSKLQCLLRVPSTDVKSTDHTADKFADFFQQKIDSIRQTTSSAPAPEISKRTIPNVLDTFSPVTSSEVHQLLKRSANKQCTSDPIPTWLVKRVGSVISPVIAAMCNKSFEQKVFPNLHKNAVVNPLLKKSTLDPSDLASYRPISNLSFVSKIIERLVNRRLSFHIDSQSLLPSTQSAYRTNFSTETALLRVHNDLVNAIDRGQIAGLVLLDLSAAFDTVNHSVLHEVFSERFGITGDALQWLLSYLQDRTQVVKLGESRSSNRKLICGVPQGSVLGPKQFIAYIGDVTEVFNNNGVHYHGYADDMQGLQSCPPAQLLTATNSFKNLITNVHDWCSSRGLQLNPLKTELIWFGSSTNLNCITPENSRIIVDQLTTIDPVHAVRDLGVFLDSELSMHDHISRVTRDCFYQLRRLRQIRRHLNLDVMKCLICSFVLSRLDYCNALLAGLSAASLRPLQRVQNAAARLILGLKWSDHITPALKELHWLPVEQRISYKLCIMVHKCLHNQCPDYLCELFTNISDIPTRSTLRSASDGKLNVPRTRLHFGERAFAVAGAQEWNSLPTELRSINDFLIFKAKLKTHFFNIAFNH